MPPDIARAMMGGFAFFLLGLFVFLFVRAIHWTWTKDPPVQFSEPFLYTATILVGLVGGVAAMTFNERLPEAPRGQPPGGGNAEPGAIKSVTGTDASLKGLANTIAPSANGDMFVIASTAYVVAYFLVGIAAIITWLSVKQTPDLVRNLALITFGLIVAIVRHFLNVPAPT